MRRINFLVALSVLVSSLAWSQGETDAGSGGQSIYKGNNAYLRDLVEKNNCRWRSGEWILNNVNSLRSALNSIDKAHWLFSLRLEEEIRGLKYCFTNHKLPPLPYNNSDDLYIFSNQAFDQPAINDKGIVFIDQNLFNSMRSKGHQAFLIIHEAGHELFSRSERRERREPRLRELIMNSYEYYMRPTDPGSFRIALEMAKMPYLMVDLTGVVKSDFVNVCQGAGSYGDRFKRFVKLDQQIKQIPQREIHSHCYWRRHKELLADNKDYLYEVALSDPGQISPFIERGPFQNLEAVAELISSDVVANWEDSRWSEALYNTPEGESFVRSVLNVGLRKRKKLLPLNRIESFLYNAKQANLEEYNETLGKMLCRAAVQEDIDLDYLEAILQVDLDEALNGECEDGRSIALRTLLRDKKFTHTSSSFKKSQLSRNKKGSLFALIVASNSYETAEDFEQIVREVHTWYLYRGRPVGGVIPKTIYDAVFTSYMIYAPEALPTFFSKMTEQQRQRSYQVATDYLKESGAHRIIVKEARELHKALGLR